jgi:hypothetical protein
MSDKTPLQEALCKAGEVIRSDGMGNVIITIERFYTLNKAAQAYADLPSKIEWLPIESSPPEPESFLAYAKHKIDEDYSWVQASWFEGRLYADSRESVIDYEDGLTATHWMPLPIPPTGESQKG